MKFWTQEERDRLRELYTKKISTEDIAKVLGRTSRAVKQKAIAEGLSSGSRSPTWTKKELEVLENCGSVPFDHIFRKLQKVWKKGIGRSESSVRRKISEIGYSVRVEADYYSFSQLASALKTSTQVPRNWLKDEKKKAILQPVGNNPVLIHYKCLRRFFKQYPAEVAKYSPDIVWLLAIAFEDRKI